MFKIIISSDRTIKQAQKVIFESSFMALLGVIFSLYPVKWILQNKYFFYLHLSKRYFYGLSRTLNIILISCIVGKILAVNRGHPL